MPLGAPKAIPRSVKNLKNGSLISFEMPTLSASDISRAYIFLKLHMNLWEEQALILLTLLGSLGGRGPKDTSEMSIRGQKWAKTANSLQPLMDFLRRYRRDASSIDPSDACRAILRSGNYPKNGSLEVPCRLCLFWISPGSEFLFTFPRRFRRDQRRLFRRVLHSTDSFKALGPGQNLNVVHSKLSQPLSHNSDD